jgi:hypothetical protein
VLGGSGAKEKTMTANSVYLQGHFCSQVTGKGEEGGLKDGVPSTERAWKRTSRHCTEREASVRKVILYVLDATCFHSRFTSIHPFAGGL